MRYYIADLHFFHSNLNDRMDCRGFADEEAMHEYMIEKWNAKVRTNDEVVILGDFSMGRGKPTMDIIKRLNGSKYLIRGNHDHYLKDRRFDENVFKWVADYKEMHDNRRKVILCHYPVFCYNGQYRMDGSGAATNYMLYGHVHNTYDEQLINRFIQEMRAEKRMIHGQGGSVSIPCQMINCFCMFSDYTPLTLDEWIEVDKKRREQMTVQI